MTYLYGDSTSSNLEVNYIEFLRDSVEFCVQILLSDQRVVQGRAQTRSLEHATAALERSSVSVFARDIRRAAGGRKIATLSIGADADFAAAVADRVLTLDPATGRLAARRRRWFM